MNNQYSIDELINNIYHFHLLDILKTQRLTEEFVVNYILNPNYQLTAEEQTITLVDVQRLQPHLNYNKLLRLYIIGPEDTNLPRFDN